MAGLRIGIDVGGTFTHGVALLDGAQVLATARVPTTHRAANGVAEGVAQVLAELGSRLRAQGQDPASVELIAHSTTQATNALLEGDVSGVHLAALAPRAERAMVRRALGTRRLGIGNGHDILVWPKLLLEWETATPEHYPAQLASVQAGPSSTSVPLPGAARTGWDGDGVPQGFRVSEDLPVVVIQPLAAKDEIREAAVAGHYRACGHSAVCASEITQVLGLQARARTAIVNAAMLPRMLSAAEFTAEAAARVMPGVPLQVVRSDGGAMSLAQLRQQPVLSLLSGPAAGASAALSLSGVSEAVFIEVGGTSTDITLIREGRVRRRYATVGGQRLMVPALDLRTVAVGGGSMLRADTALFGPRSAHIAGLPYLFQALAAGQRIGRVEAWREPQGGKASYLCVRLSDGSLAAFTLTDLWLSVLTPPLARESFGLEVTEEQIGLLREAVHRLGAQISGKVPLKAKRSVVSHMQRTLEARGISVDAAMRRELLEQQHRSEGSARVVRAFTSACNLITDAVYELTREHDRELLADYWLVGGGGGAPAVMYGVGTILKLHPRVKLIPHHSVISAIGAALAVSTASLSRSVANPTGADIAALTQEVEALLLSQGAERAETDFEYDPFRQVLTVTGRGSRPYEQGAQPLAPDALKAIAVEALGDGAQAVWDSPQAALWLDTLPPPPGLDRRRWPRGRRRALVLHQSGRALWRGTLMHFEPAAPGGIEAALTQVLGAYTQYTDGGPSLPGLALVCAGRFIPLDQLGSGELAAEALRWENLPAHAPGCFVLRV